MSNDFESFDSDFSDDHYDATETIPYTLTGIQWTTVLAALQEYLASLTPKEFNSKANAEQAAEDIATALLDHAPTPDNIPALLSTPIPITVDLGIWESAETLAAIKLLVQSLTKKADRPVRRNAISALREMDRIYCRNGDNSVAPLDDLI